MPGHNTLYTAIRVAGIETYGTVRRNTFKPLVVAGDLVLWGGLILLREVRLNLDKTVNVNGFVINMKTTYKEVTRIQV